MKIKNYTVKKLDVLLLFILILVVSYGIIGFIIIPIISPDPIINSFPITCPHPDNCTRVADTFNRAEGMTPPNLQANYSQVKQAIKLWMDGQTILNETANFMHIKWTQQWTRFIDDVLIELQPGSDSNHTVVWIQSQSRLGSYDFNTNTNRVHSLIDFLTSFNFSN